MTRQDLMDEILDLPLEERIELVGDVWDTIAASADEVPTPEWHLRGLDRRLSRKDISTVEWSDVEDSLRDRD
jgi:putative addiction module component (TIGR02574 family)